MQAGVHLWKTKYGIYIIYNTNYCRLAQLQYEICNYVMCFRNNLNKAEQEIVAQWCTVSFGIYSFLFIFPVFVF